MMDRDRFMRVLGADPAKWAKRWGIKPASAPCYTCDAERVTSIPFATGALRGLMAPVCPCGNDRGPYCVVDSQGRCIVDVLDTDEPKPRRKRAKKRKLRLVTP